MAELTFFFDRNFGTRLPDAIRRLRPEFSVEWHQKHFEQDSEDDQWMAALGGKGWVVLSHDIKWHSVAIETKAIRQHRLGCFYLPGAESPIWLKAEVFFRAYRKMVDLASKEAPPYVFDVSRDGTIKRVDLP